MRRNIQRAALLAGALVASGAMAQAAQDFILMNDTGATIARAYVSPTLSDDWGHDVLGRDVLQDGESTRIMFSPLNDICIYDIRVEDLYGNALMRGGLNLCRLSYVTVN